MYLYIGFWTHVSLIHGFQIYEYTYILITRALKLLQRKKNKYKFVFIKHTWSTKSPQYNARESRIYNLVWCYRLACLISMLWPPRLSRLGRLLTPSTIRTVSEFNFGRCVHSDESIPIKIIYSLFSRLK